MLNPHPTGAPDDLLEALCGDLTPQRRLVQYTESSEARSGTEEPMEGASYGTKLVELGVSKPVGRGLGV